MSQTKSAGEHWLVRLLCGTFGYKATSFFEIMKLSNENERLAKERDAYFKKHGLRK